MLPRAPRWHPVALGIWLACLAGCAAIDDLAGQRTAFPVGENTLGEACRVDLAPTDPQFPFLPGSYGVFCGGWEEPSAIIVRVRDSRPAAELAAAGPWHDRLQTLANCPEAQATSMFGGGAAVTLDCRLRVGSWPYNAFVVQAGGQAFLVDGIPVAVPAAVRAIGVLSGRLPRSEADRGASLSDDIATLKARLTDARYSGRHLAAFRDLLRLAQFHNFQGNFALAEASYRKALEIEERVLAGDRGGLAFLFMQIALELSNQQRYDEADALFQAAAGLVSASFEPTDESRLISYLAIDSANRGKGERAMRLASKATNRRIGLVKRDSLELLDAYQPRLPPQSSERLTMASSSPSAGEVTLSRAETARGDVVQSRTVEASMLIRQKQDEKADGLLDDALEILALEPRVPRRWGPQILLLKAQIAEQHGKLDKASEYLMECIEVQQTLFTTSRFEGLAKLALARILEKRGNRPEALKTFKDGFDILSQEGSGIDFDEALPFFLAELDEANKEPDQRQAIHQKMFEVAQMVRGPVTAQTMALTFARLAAADTDAGKQIRDLQDAKRRRYQISEAKARAYADPNTLGYDLEDLERRWGEINKNIIALERGVQAAQPRYNQLVDSQLPAAKVQSVLASDEALVQLLAGETGAIGFLVTASSIQAYRVDATEASLSQAITGRLRKQSRLPIYVNDAHRLYGELFGPIDNDLRPYKHLVVVANGTLLSLPFGVLVTEQPESADGVQANEVAWMARQHAISVAPSVQSFVNLRTSAQPSRASKPFVGFGDALPSKNVDAGLAASRSPSCQQDVSYIAGLPALPGTKEEIRRVAASFGAGSAQFFESDFTEANIKGMKLRKYKTVYFATHGVLPGTLECHPEPFLVTTPPPTIKGDEDGMLTASEVAELRLDADLVVLSACNSAGAGSRTGGESLSGLARAFFYAGSRSVLVTHWRIDDEATVQLMTVMFDAMANQRLPAAEALRKGQLALIETPGNGDWSHPAYWGAFALVGDGLRSTSGTLSAAVSPSVALQ